ncbi:MAG: hypothetical protein NVSMB3_03790 [Acidobacteriaceae bacterium]
MTPELWERVKGVFDEAAELPMEEQAECVRRLGGGDAELVAEVLRLLHAAEGSAPFLETPLANLHDFLEPRREEPLLAEGTVVASRFEILQFLNRGGMGEVYEAWDAELQERIALKTIQPRIASNAEAIERFKREVKHAREISHPNICRVHELFSDEIVPGQRIWFLSMELLPGPTLLELIRSEGPLKSSAALPIAGQMVSALAAAHALGVVHRDFKSSNVIMMRGAAAETRAVITDFGLSLSLLKPSNGVAEPGGMGTPGYSAPEQERDGKVGPLADQYSLGAVLCEMMTGSLPRWGKAAKGAHKEVLELPVHRFAPRWEGVIRRCMEREPEHRFAAIEEVAKALRPPGILGTPLRLAAALLLLASVAGAGLLWMRDRARCRICNVVQLTPETDESESPSLSRDGHAIVYSSDRADTGNLDIFLQRLPKGRPVRLTSDPARDGDPSISGDGAVIAFRSEREGGGIYVTGANGGKERLVVPRGRNPQISPDGRSLLYWIGDTDVDIASGRIFRIAVEGGEPVPLAESFQDARFPVWGPDGRSFLFTGCRSKAEILPGCLEWFIATLDGSRVVNTHALERLSRDEFVASRTGAVAWFQDGILLSGGANGVRANLSLLKLNQRTWTVEGGARALLREETRDLSPTVASDGTVAYTRSSGALHVWRIDHAAEPGAATFAKVTEDADIDGTPYISEDGRSLVFTRGRGSQRSLWMRDSVAGTERLLLSPGTRVQSPVVDARGDMLAYEETGSDGTSIFLMSKEGQLRRLCHGCSLPTGWFDSDRALIYRDGATSVVKMIDPRTGRDWVVLAEEGASLSEGSWSPVHELMLFVETKGDRKRIFAVRVPRATGRAEGKTISVPDSGVSPDRPRWSGDGRTIFYISNSDGSTCLYGQSFSPERGQVVGTPFAVRHFHNQRATIDNVFPPSFNLTVSGDSLYFNLGEQSSTIWIGTLKRQ